MFERQPVTNNALDKLPLFADDHDIAVAIVGKARATYFKSILPILERRGFPRKCPLHGGRSVFLIRLFYQAYYAPEVSAVRYGAESYRGAEQRLLEEENWQRRLDVKTEKKARAKANSDAWAEKKRRALEEFRAKKGAESRSKAAKAQGQDD